MPAIIASTRVARRIYLKPGFITSSRNAMFASGVLPQCASSKSHDYLDFVLPSFEPFEAVLQRGTPPSPKLRRFIVTKLFQQCFAIAWYPSRQLYHVAAERLVIKYPHLINRIDYGSGLDSWIQALRNKFKNTRKKVETCSEEMELLKRKSHHTSQKEATEAPPPNKKLCRLSTSADADEDLDLCVELTDDEIVRQVAEDSDESGTVNEEPTPNTQPTSSELTVSVGTPPFHAELHTIVYGETPESLQSHKAWLMDRVLSATCDDNALKLRLRATAKERHDKLKGMEVREAIATFPFLSFEATDQVPLPPCLRTTEGRVALFVGQVLITEASSFLGGVCCLFAAFWVFHIEYPNKAHRLLTFLKHALLSLGQTRPRIKATELTNFFKANMQ